MKTCRKCKETKSCNDFYRNSDGYGDGLRNECIACRLLDVKEYADKNKEAIAERSRQYYLKRKAKKAEEDRKAIKQERWNKIQAEAKKYYSS